MAITLLQTPLDYTPAFNQAYFSASSTQTAQPNFKYTIVIIDVITGDSQTYDVLPAPSTKLEGWNAQSFLAAYMTTTFVFLLAGWQKYASVRKYQVNIGETYDVASVQTYFTGTTNSYYTWNAHLDFLTFAQYSSGNYVYNDPNKVYLAGVTDDITFEDRSSYLYVLASNAVVNIKLIQIETYNAAGALIGASYVINPFAATSDYKEKYASIDVGYKGLLALSAPQVTGVFPIITASVASYKISDRGAIAFQTTTCAMSGFLTISFTVDPGLSVTQAYDYTIKNPTTTGASGQGVLIITGVVGGGSYTTNIACNIFVSSVDGGYIYLQPITFIKQFKISCAPKYQVHTVHFKARDGSFGTVNFQKLPEYLSEKQETIYKINPNTFVNNAYGYDYTAGTERSLATQDKTGLTLRTDWLTDEQVQKYKECYTAGTCYLDLGSALYKRIRPTNVTYQENPIYDKLVQLTMTFKYSHESHRDD